MRELGDGGGLARPVDPDHQYDLWARKGVDVERFGDRTQHSGDFVRDDLAQFLGTVRGDVAALGEAVADARGHRRAEVGGDQRFLDAVEIILVEPRLAGQPGEIFAEPLRRAAKSAEQPFAPALAGHAAISFASIWVAIIRSPSRAVRRTSMMVPGAAGAASVTAAKFSA